MRYAVVFEKLGETSWMMCQIPSGDPLAGDGGWPTGGHSRDQLTMRLSIRSLLVLQSIVAMVMVVFIEHSGWGIFLVALLAACGSAFATRQLRGKCRFVGFVVAAVLSSLLYVLSAGPYLGVGRIFDSATRAQIHGLFGWTYRPLNIAPQPKAQPVGLRRQDSAKTRLHDAYLGYLKSFR